MTKLKYVHKIGNRHGGEPFYYFRRGKERGRIKGMPGSREFMTRYQQLLAEPTAEQTTLRLPRLRLVKPTEPNRFHHYCEQATIGAHGRAKNAGVPCTIDEKDINDVLLKQNYRCAISGLPLIPSEDHPYRPSLDRIIPANGYIPGNIRIITMMINQAMGHWGLDTFLTVVGAVYQKHLERRS